jgi:hypothetical protein
MDSGALGVTRAGIATQVNRGARTPRLILHRSGAHTCPATAGREVNADVVRGSTGALQVDARARKAAFSRLAVSVATTLGDQDALSLAELMSARTDARAVLADAWTDALTTRPLAAIAAADTAGTISDARRLHCRRLLLIFILLPFRQHSDGGRDRLKGGPNDPAQRGSA